MGIGVALSRGAPRDGGDVCWSELLLHRVEQLGEGVRHLVDGSWHRPVLDAGDRGRVLPAVFHHGSLFVEPATAAECGGYCRPQQAQRDELERTLEIFPHLPPGDADAVTRLFFPHRLPGFS